MSIDRPRRMRATWFTIPMRGNEEMMAWLLDQDVRTTFTIPMRGNE